MRTLVFIENDIYVRNFYLSGALDGLWVLHQAMGNGEKKLPDCEKEGLNWRRGA